MVGHLAIERPVQHLITLFPHDTDRVEMICYINFASSVSACFYQEWRDRPIGLPTFRRL